MVLLLLIPLKNTHKLVNCFLQQNIHQYQKITYNDFIVGATGKPMQEQYAYNKSFSPPAVTDAFIAASWTILLGGQSDRYPLLNNQLLSEIQGDVDAKFIIGDSPLGNTSIDSLLRGLYLIHKSFSTQKIKDTWKY